MSVHNIQQQQQHRWVQHLCTLMLLLLVSSSKALGNEAVSDSTILSFSRVVEVIDKNFPVLLNSSSAQIGGPGDAAQQGPGGFAKRARTYVTPDTFNDSSSSLNDAMKLPEERAGLKLSRWVICSWLVANISAADAMKNTNNVFLERIPELLRSVQNLAPQQVYAVAAANITLGFTFTGIRDSSLSKPATDALVKVASDMAGGYKEELIVVATEDPGHGEAALAFESSIQDGNALAQQREDQPAAAPSTGRRLQQQQQAFALSDSSVGHLQHPAMQWAVVRAGPRRLLLQAAPQPPAAAAGSAASGDAALPTWLMYTKVAPGNTTALITELCLACNITAIASIAVGTDFAQRPCGLEVKAALTRAGMSIDDDKYAQILSVPPTISLSVRLAIGMTEAQVADGTDATLRSWLERPETAQAVARMYAPDAVVSWLHKPQVIQFHKPHKYPASLSPGAAAGVAVGGAVVLCTVILLGVWLVYRHRRRHQGYSDDGKTDGTESQAGSSSSRRRRRREGKRRYLLPDPPRPDSNTTSVPAVTPEAPCSSSAVEGDTELTPDQIRPQLRSLGDSVTSAVRFEQSDDEEGDQEDAAAEGSSAGIGLAAAGAAAAAAAVAAGAALGAGAAGSSSSSSSGAGAAPGTAAASRRAVLDARAALMSEYREKEQQERSSHAAGFASSSHCNGIELMPCAVSPELAAAAEICSAVATPGNSRGFLPTLSAGGDSQAAHEQGGSSTLLQPVDERAAAASAAAVAAAAALPLAGAVAASRRRASPFAQSYNFDGLGPAGSTGQDPTAAAAAAIASESVKAVALSLHHQVLHSPTRDSTGELDQPHHVQEITAAGSPASSASSSHRPSSAAAMAAAGIVARGSDRRHSSSSSSSGGNSSLPSPSGSNGVATGALPAATPSPQGRKGVVLQTLVSISPSRAPRCSGDSSEGQEHSGGQAADVLLPPLESGCPSLSQDPSDNYPSTLQLSSSMSATMLQPNSSGRGTLSAVSYGTPTTAT